LMDVIRAYCRSLDEHGFEHIVLVPTHGGNFGPVKTVAPDVGREIEATVIPLADLDEHMQLLNDGLSEAGIDYQQEVIHAGAAETAVVLALNEDLVRMENIEPGPEGKISTARLLSEGFKTITQNGVLGDPAEATPEAGETIIQNVVDTYVGHVETERRSV
jgi:creatinine amidohydrolase